MEAPTHPKKINPSVKNLLLPRNSRRKKEMKFRGVYVFKEKNIEKREGKEKGKEQKMQ